MRARSLKPGFFLNERLGTSEPLYGTIFAGLWCIADREGRLEDRPLKIHASINPYRDQSSTIQALEWLDHEGFVRRYVVEGKPYLIVVNFRRHQSPHINEGPSRLPEPPVIIGETSPYDVPSDKSGASTVQVPESHESTRSDSGLLTPSSLTPESSTKSGANAPGDGSGSSAKPTKSRRQERKTSEFDPAAVPGLNVTAWSSYVEHRRKLHVKPLTSEGAWLLALKLAQHDATTQQSMIDQTRMNGWQGVFDLKHTNGSGAVKAPYVPAKSVAELEAIELPGNWRRVMLSTERVEFDKQLAELCAGFDRPVTESRTTAYWRGLAKMALADFGRVVEYCLSEKAPEKFPTVHVCWELSRMLKPVRALGALANRGSEGDDPWLIRANLHLLRHIRTKVTQNGPRYCGSSPADCAERVACLVAAKNAWALDMRESAESRADRDWQFKLWNELIETAEARIDAIIAGRLELVA